MGRMVAIGLRKYSDIIEKQDEYDTPMQEAYVDGYWEELTAKGITPERIRKYGFAFQGKQVLMGCDMRRESL